jgi:hypothetical protein
VTHLEQSMATHTALVKQYGNKWPNRKRWRVEGSRAGNSRLLMNHTAVATCARYGGKVVEVIPMIPLAERQAAKMPTCPRCEAPAGKPCKSRNAKVVKPHLVRWDKLNDQDPG